MEHEHHQNEREADKEESVESRNVGTQHRREANATLKLMMK